MRRAKPQLGECDLNFAKKYLEEKAKREKELLKMAKKNIELNKKLRERLHKQQQEKNENKEEETTTPVE